MYSVIVVTNNRLIGATICQHQSDAYTQFSCNKANIEDFESESNANNGLGVGSGQAKTTPTPAKAVLRTAHHAYPKRDNHGTPEDGQKTPMSFVVRAYTFLVLHIVLFAL